MDDHTAAIRRGMDYARTSETTGQASAAAFAVIRSADTGAKPLLVACDDGHQYWAKGPGNPHGNLSLAHEWVISELSRALQGPLPVGVLIEVDDSLLIGASVNGTPRTGSTWFGSRVILGEEATYLQHANHDGNSHRLPYYLALWHLCLGVDPQFVYERAEHDRVWSIDHGLWFDNAAGDWTELGGLNSLAGCRWEDPQWRGVRKLDVQACLEAATEVEALTGEVVGEIVGSVPVEWGISDDDLEHLAEFILTRRPITAATLRARTNQP